METKNIKLRKSMAYIIDILIYFCPLIFIFGLIILDKTFDFGISKDFFIYSTILSFILFLLLMLYNFILRESFSVSSSWGKQLMNLKVVKLDGNKISLGQSFVRFVIFSSLGIISTLFVFFDKHQRSAHDILSKTKVVYQP